MTDRATPLRQSTLADLGRAGVDVPTYDRSALRGSIVHIGVGGFHRSHLATYVDDLCRMGNTDWSVVGAGVLPGDARMASVLAEQDHCYTLVARGTDATSVRVIGSITDYVHAHPDATPLVERIADADVAIVSLTVTEGGYPVDGERAFDPASRNAGPGSAFDVLVRGLRRRRSAGLPPVTVLSCDNVTGNGDVARTATIGLARRRDPGLADWIDDAITFPNSMVDRITPATTDSDRAWLVREHGIDDGWPVVAEPFRQWVVEDRFAGPRLPLEDLDVIVTDHVEPYEACKLRLLNAGHSVLAYPTRLAGHRRVDEALAEPRFAALLQRFLRTEAAPVVPRAPGIDIDDYIATLVVRFANPAISDQVDRLCADGSSKIPTFLLPTVRDQLAAGGPVEVAALVIAAWCSYLRGTDEQGTAFDVAPDPRLAAVTRAARGGPTDVLDLTEVFGEVGRDARLRTAVAAAHTAIAAHGIRATTDRLLG